MQRLMPRGTPLHAEEWRRRHAIISLIALAHVPAVFVYALAVDVGLLHATVEMLPVLVTAYAGYRTYEARMAGELLTTFSLVTSSAVLVHLSNGLIEMHFHFFVVVALVTLYQQWPPFLLAIGFVALHHGIAGVIDPGAVYNHPAAIASPWTWAGIHAGFIAMASAVGIANWKMNEIARERAERYFRQLYEGELAVVRRLEDTNRIKDELVAAVSHEFRTPLTAILGLSETLARPGLVAPADVGQVAGRIQAQGARLQLLVENLLDADVGRDLGAGWCELATVVDAVVRMAREATRTTLDIRVDIADGTAVGISADAAQLAVTNLVSNAVKFGTAGAPIRITAGPGRHGEVVVAVSNEGPEVTAALRARMFEPFVQGDSSSTRVADGVGLGLSVVHRIVSAVAGSVDVRSADGVTTFELHLPPSGAGHPPDPMRTERVQAGQAARRN